MRLLLSPFRSKVVPQLCVGVVDVLVICLIIGAFPNASRITKSISFLMAVAICSLLSCCYRIYHFYAYPTTTNSCSNDENIESQRSSSISRPMDLQVQNDDINQADSQPLTEVAAANVPFQGFFLVVDILVALLMLSSTISALATPGLADLCQESVYAHSQQVKNSCQRVYAAVGFGFIATLCYFLIVFLSFMEFKEVHQLKFSWGYFSKPNWSVGFFVRVCQVVCCVLAIACSSSVVEGSDNINIPIVFSFIVAAASVSILITLLLIYMYDFQSHVFQSQNDLLVVLLQFLLLVLNSSAAIKASINDATSNCDSTSYIKCGMVYSGIVFSFFLCFTHVFSIVQIYLFCTSFSWPKILGGSEELQNPLTFCVRSLLALFGFIAYCVGLACIKDTILVTLLTKANLVIASGFISFSFGLFSMCYENILHFSFGHVIIPRGIEIGLILLNAMSGILAADSNICEGNVAESLFVSDCSAWKAAFAFNFLCAIVILFLLNVWYLKPSEQDNLTEKRNIPLSNALYFRIAQIIFGVITFATAASIPGSHPRVIEILIGVGVVATIISSGYSYHYLILGNRLFHPNFPVVIDVVMGIACLMAGISSAASDIAKCGRNSNSGSSCATLETSIVFVWFLAAAYGGSFTYWFLMSRESTSATTQPAVENIPVAEFVGSSSQESEVEEFEIVTDSPNLTSSYLKQISPSN